MVEEIEDFELTRYLLKVGALLAHRDAISEANCHEYPSFIAKAYLNWCLANGLKGNIERHGVRAFRVYVNDWNAIKRLARQFEEKDMAEAKKTEEKSSTTANILSAAKDGFKLGVANEAGEVILTTLTTTFPHLAPHFETATGRAIGKAVAASAIMYAAEASGVEDRELLNKICALVVTASSLEVTEDQLKVLRPVFTKLITLAKSLPEVAGAATY